MLSAGVVEKGALTAFEGIFQAFLITAPVDTLLKIPIMPFTAML
jgi:hypothetical protein